MMEELAVKIEHLNYSFGSHEVLKEMSFNLEVNKIYGLLGRNGAGKTTLINLLVNQLIAREGSIQLFGEDPRKNPAILKKVCIAREAEFYAPYMKGKAILQLYSQFYEGYDKQLEQKLVAFFDIPVDIAYRKYSRGMKSLLFMIVALCSKAPLTILDEPTLGMDAPNREQFYKILLDEYVKEPRTFMISTHLINEIENLLEEVIIIDQGERLLQEEVESLKSKAIYLSGNKEELERLTALKMAKPKESFGKSATYAYIGELDELDQKLIQSTHIEISPMSIQQIFVELTKGKEYE